MQYTVNPPEYGFGLQIFIAEEIRRAERYSSDKLGVPKAALIESAGLQLAEAALQLLREHKSMKRTPRIAVVCGSGHNGSTGIVAARYLANAKMQTEVIACGPLTPTTGEYLISIRKMGLQVVELTTRDEIATLPHPSSYDLIIDALFGTGLDRPVGGMRAEAISWINGHGALVVSADIASGVNSDTGEAKGAAVKADLTVTYGASKIGHWVGRGPELTGKLVIADVGIPRVAFELARLHESEMPYQRELEYDPASMSMEIPADLSTKLAAQMAFKSKDNKQKAGKPLPEDALLYHHLEAATLPVPPPGNASAQPLSSQESKPNPESLNQTTATTEQATQSVQKESSVEKPRRHRFTGTLKPGAVIKAPPCEQSMTLMRAAMRPSSEYGKSRSPQDESIDAPLLLPGGAKKPHNLSTLYTKEELDELDNTISDSRILGHLPVTFTDMGNDGSPFLPPEDRIEDPDEFANSWTGPLELPTDPGLMSEEPIESLDEPQVIIPLSEKTITATMPKPPTQEPQDPTDEAKTSAAEAPAEVDAGVEPVSSEQQTSSTEQPVLAEGSSREADAGAEPAPSEPEKASNKAPNEAEETTQIPESIADHIALAPQRASLPATPQSESEITAFPPARPSYTDMMNAILAETRPVLHKEEDSEQDPQTLNLSAETDHLERFSEAANEANEKLKKAAKKERKKGAAEAAERARNTQSPQMLSATSEEAIQENDPVAEAPQESEAKPASNEPDQANLEFALLPPESPMSEPEPQIDLFAEPKPSTTETAETAKGTAETAKGTVATAKDTAATAKEADTEARPKRSKQKKSAKPAPAPAPKAAEPAPKAQKQSESIEEKVPSKEPAPAQKAAEPAPEIKVKPTSEPRRKTAHPKRETVQPEPAPAKPKKEPTKPVWNFFTTENSMAVQAFPQVDESESDAPASDPLLAQVTEPSVEAVARPEPPIAEPEPKPEPISPKTAKPRTAPAKPRTAPAKPRTAPAKPIAEKTAKPKTTPAKPKTAPAKPKTAPAKPKAAPAKTVAEKPAAKTPSKAHKAPVKPEESVDLFDDDRQFNLFSLAPMPVRDVTDGQADLQSEGQKEANDAQMKGDDAGSQVQEEGALSPSQATNEADAAASESQMKAQDASGDASKESEKADHEDASGDQADGEELPLLLAIEEAHAKAAQDTGKKPKKRMPRSRQMRKRSLPNRFDKMGPTSKEFLEKARSQPAEEPKKPEPKSEDPHPIIQMNVSASAIDAFSYPIDQEEHQLLPSDPPRAINCDLLPLWQSRRILTEEDALIAFKDRNMNAHKGSQGHVYVLGGSQGRTGCIRLCGHAALKAGAGLATLGTTFEAFGPLSAQLYELMSEPILNEATDKNLLIRHLNQFTALAIGPGFDHRYAPLLRAILPNILAPAVIDAEALNAVAERIPDEGYAVLGLLGRGGPRVLTPHPGEAARLLGCSPSDIQTHRTLAAYKLYQTTNAVVVLKGANTLICGPSGIRVCPFGNPGMATAGMGDVLAGIIAALLARGVQAERAAWAGVVWHALAGDKAAEQSTQNAVVTRDLIAALSTVERELHQQGLSASGTF